MGDSEARIQNQILQAIGCLPGVLCWRNNTGALPDPRTGRVVHFGSPGSPDILCIVSGRFIGLEVKTRNGKQRPDQRSWQQACEAAGGIYAVVRSAEEAMGVIERAR